MTSMVYLQACICKAVPMHLWTHAASDSLTESASMYTTQMIDVEGMSTADIIFMYIYVQSYE